MAGVVQDIFHIQTKEDHESKLAIAGNPFLLFFFFFGQVV
jgi:hypothetical protein